MSKRLLLQERKKRLWRRRFLARVAATAPSARIKGPRKFCLSIRSLSLSLGRPSARSISASFWLLVLLSSRGARRLNYRDDVARTHTPKAFYNTRVWRRVVVFLLDVHAAFVPTPAAQRSLPKSTDDSNHSEMESILKPIKTIF